MIRNIRPSENNNRTVAALFQFLNDTILLQPNFGLDDDDDYAEIITMEDELRHIEKIIQASGRYG